MAAICIDARVGRTAIGVNRYSLSDRDLMSLLDDLKENMGNSFGPHFWVTADEVSEEKMMFLCEHYNIQTIKYSLRQKKRPD